MASFRFTKKIKRYAIASLLIPLIAINSCFLIYKFIGDISERADLYPNFNWSLKKIVNTYEEHQRKVFDLKEHKLTNCSEYHYGDYYVTSENKILPATIENVKLIKDLVKNNKIKSAVRERTEKIDYKCIKNHKSLYSLIKKLSFFEPLIVHAILYNPAGFSKINNPYLYGEVSISRTARYFPATLIFKPLIILSAFLLFLYWKNNLNLFNELKNNNILTIFSKNFFYLGAFSCLFLILHAIFLGLDFDSKIFDRFRRLIIILFILCEMIAQIFLTRNLFKFKNELKEYINPSILKVKIIFVTLVFLITIISFSILSFGDPSTAFKHILEWNYFSFLLLFYLLSRLLWK